jgi:SulP family sulfate permease
MTNTKHNSNKELVSQGICNCVLPLFGAIPSTAAIARSAVNIREGAKTRMAGVYHALFLLIILLFFSPFALYIPKAFLAGVLMVVSIRMINLQELKAIIHTGKYESAVLFITLILTIFTDLVFAVQVGMLLAIFLLFVRMINVTNVKCMEEYDSNGAVNSVIKNDSLLKEKVSVYTIHGPFFFGAMNVFEQKIKEHIHSERPLIIIRLKHVPFIDGTAFIQLVQFLESRKKIGSKVLFTEFWPGLKEEMLSKKDFARLVSKEEIFSSVGDALSYAKRYLRK